MVYIKDLFKKLQQYDVGYLYVVKAGDYFKVGFATLPEQRIQLIKTDNALPVEVLCLKKVPYAKELEHAIHGWLITDGFRFRNEWYNYDEKIISNLLAEIETLTDNIKNEEILALL